MVIFKFKEKSKRKVFLDGEIDDNLASRVVSEILKLADESSTDEIELIINSPGGRITSGVAIYDAIQYVQCDVITVIVGEASGVALLIAASATRGKRYLLKESIVGLVSISSDGSDNKIQNANQKEVIDRAKMKIYSIFSSITGQELHKIISDSENETYLSAEEAIKYGLADKII